MPDLDRFRTAQDQPGSGFAAALAEIQAGRKQGHWIWYVFPQLSGLGHSASAQAYGISSADEAAAYLRDPILRSRLFAITTAVAERLRDRIALTTLMGSRIDALKLVSALTLFSEIARRLSGSDELDDYASFAQLADQVLDDAALQGYPRCEQTRRTIATPATAPARANVPRSPD